MLEVKGQLNALGVAQQIKASGGGSSLINYSTEEQDTGIKWLDDRDIFQKTYSFENAVSLTKDSYTSTGVDAPGEKLVGVTAYTTTGIFACGGDINEGKIRLLNPRANDAVPVIGMTVLYVKALS